MADLTINENTYIGFTANKTEAEAKADKSSNRMNICKNKKLYLNGQRLGLTDEEAAALQNGQSGGNSGSGSGTDYSDEITALQSTVSGHTSSIQLMQTKNNDQDAAITALRNKNTEQDTDIDTLQSEVAALKAGGSSGSGSGTVSWAIDLGESDNSSNSDMPYKAPSRAADPAIAGNKNIRRILFTATDGDKTYGAYIEQVVYEKACVQMMFINGRRFDRFIDFTDYNRTEINTATSVGGIQPWQRTDPRNLSYNASTRRLTLANMWGQSIGSDVQLPLSTDSADGLMPKGTLSEISQLKSDVATLRNTVEAGGSSGSGSSGGTTDTAQLNAELTVLEQCLLGGQLVEIAGFAPEGTTLTTGTTTLSPTPISCPVYFVPGTNGMNGGFGALKGGSYWANWSGAGSWPKDNYPSVGSAVAYETGTSTVYLIKSTLTGWTYTRIGATDKATFDAIRARYTAVENLSTTTAGHETRIATLETDVAALKAGSGSGSGSSGTTAEVMKVDVGALDSLCSSVEVAKSLIQHAEKMRYVVTTTSGGVTIAVGELVMYADAGGKQVTQELSSHYLITGNNISSGSVRLDAANTFCRSFGVLSNAHSTTGSWTKWKPKGGILDIGISDINSNSAIRMNVPSLLQNALICGNLYVARVLFTIKLTSNGNTYSGTVDQIVSSNQCVQRMQLNGRLFTRSIDFSDAARGTVSFVQPWQDSEARNLSYNKSTGAIGMANMWGDAVGQSATIPVSDDTYKGLVPAGTLSKLGTLYGAQQRTWALNEPALQFDFFEKNKLDNTMLTSNGYDTSFFLFKFSKTYGAGINTSDINPNVVIHVDTACPTSYTYNGVTYTSISRYIAVFRKYNRKGRHKYHGDEQNRYYSKKKSGYIEFLGNKYIAGSGLRSQFYSENFSPMQNSGDFYFSNVHQIISQLRCMEPNHKYITLPHAAHNHLFQQVATGSKQRERFVDTLKIGLCLVLECKKSGYRPVYIYGPMIKGRLISTYYVNNFPCEMKFNRS